MPPCDCQEVPNLTGLRPSFSRFVQLITLFVVLSARHLIAVPYCHSAKRLAFDSSPPIVRQFDYDLHVRRLGPASEVDSRQDSLSDFWINLVCYVENVGRLVSGAINRATRLIIHLDSIGTRVVFAPLFTIFSVFSHDQSHFPFRSTISID